MEHSNSYHDQTNGVIEAYRNVASAIIMQAIRDYVSAAKTLKKIPAEQIHNRRADRIIKAEKEKKRRFHYRRSKIEATIDHADLTIAECSKFFRSELFKKLTDDIDGVELLNKLREMTK